MGFGTHERTHDASPRDDRPSIRCNGTAMCDGTKLGRLPNPGVRARTLGSRRQFLRHAIITGLSP